MGGATGTVTMVPFIMYKLLENFVVDMRGWGNIFKSGVSAWMFDVGGSDVRKDPWGSG